MLTIEKSKLFFSCYKCKSFPDIILKEKKIIFICKNCYLLEIETFEDLIDNKSKFISNREYSYKEIDLLDDFMKKEMDKYFFIKKSLIKHLNKFKKNNVDNLSKIFIEKIKNDICNNILNNAETTFNSFILKYMIDFTSYYSLKSKTINNLKSVINKRIKIEEVKFENYILKEKDKILSFQKILKDREISFLTNYIKNLFEPYNRNINSFDDKRQFLEDAINFSVILKKYILLEQIKNDNNYINPDIYLNDIKNYSKELNSEKDGNFILSLLGKIIKEDQAKVYITMKKDERFNDIELASLQTYLCLKDQEKYELHFDLGEEFNKKILSNDCEQKLFIDKLKNDLSKTLKTDKNRIILTNVHHGCFATDCLIIDKTKEEERLMNENLDRLHINKIEKKKIFDVLLLNSDILDPRFDRNKQWGINEKRGGENYIPPLKNWNGYGLNVINKYDNGNNIWLDYHNLEGEYSIGYLGISNLKDEIENIIYLEEDSQNIINSINVPEPDENNIKNFKKGNRVCVFQDPEIAEKNAGYIEINGYLITIMFMIRINPKEKKNYNGCWIVDSSPKNIRPYRILIKKIERTPDAPSHPLLVKTILDQNFIIQIELSDENIFDDLRKNNKLVVYSKMKDSKGNDQDVDKYLFAIRLYSSAYYCFINNYLRSREILKNVSWIDINGKKHTLENLNEEQIKSWTKVLQKALKIYTIKDPKYKIEDNTIVYRRIKNCRFEGNYGIGSQFYLPEFISTTLSKGFAKKWTYGEGTLYSIIIRNNGTNGHPKYCQYIADLSVSNQEPQYEALIAPNCLYRVTNIIRQEKIDEVSLICEGLMTQ